MCFLTGALEKPQTRIIYNQIQNGSSDNDSSTGNNRTNNLAFSAQNQKELRGNPLNQVADRGHEGKDKTDGASDTSQKGADKNGAGDTSKHAPSSQVYRKKGNFPEEKQKIIAHASRISNNDLDFIATLDKENAGTWDVNITSKKNKNGTYDKGLCQFNSQYYGHLYKDKDWENPEWQINKCWELYSGWKKKGVLAKRLFAYPKRHASKLNFELTQ